MKKSDLKAGMLLITRGGDRMAIEVGNRVMLLVPTDGYYVCVSITDCDEDLLSRLSKRWDIMEIYQHDKLCFDKDPKKLIWKRKETKEYSMQEIADKLGIDVKDLRIKA